MRKVRYTLDSLDQALREKGVFDIEEVDYAVLEDNGVVSVLKKDEYKYVTKKDMKLLSNDPSFPHRINYGWKNDGEKPGE